VGNIKLAGKVTTYMFKAGFYLSRHIYCHLVRIFSFAYRTAFTKK